MRRDVIAVGMRNKREGLSIPWVEPKVFLWQINATFITNFDHQKFYPRNWVSETGIRVRYVAVALTARYVSLSLTPMKFATIFLLAAVSVGHALAADTPKVLAKVNPLPLALSNDLQFRKTKLFYLSEIPPKSKKSLSSALSSNPNNPTAGIAEASLGFERTYRMYGAITAADQHQRFGNYLDFFWRANRPANVTVRLEYRQEKLRSFVQAREITYTNAKGNRKTEFAVIGDDYFNDGRVIAWRCLLIENGHIVAENRSYLWE
jgi:hypothetical protein